MQFRAVVTRKGEWWIGWLIDLPGVNAQEKTRTQLIRSLSMAAQEMLESEVSFEPGAEMIVVTVTDPQWAGNAGNSLVAEESE